MSHHAVPARQQELDPPEIVDAEIVDVDKPLALEPADIIDAEIVEPPPFVSPLDCPQVRLTGGVVTDLAEIEQIRASIEKHRRPRAAWRSALRLLPILTAGLVAVSACTPVQTVAVTTGAAGSGNAVTMLASLPVKGRAPKTGYTREQFGQAWADTDRNGCDTRNDILRRDLASPTLKAGTHGCVVLTGTLFDPYTGHQIAFVRGESTSTAVQIDHMVALSDAWQTGAQQLTTVDRMALANDPLNLQAVDGPTNAAKGDSDAASWLPPNRTAWCDYASRQVAVKVRYHLWVTAAEHDALARVLATCPGVDG